MGMEPFLVVLRKWNSYTPSLPSSFGGHEAAGRYSIGGGYFLFVPGGEYGVQPGYGLVIDPGYNFIHNFGLAGLCLDDINGILITHAHNDHTNDFESLLALLHERNAKYRGDRRQKTVDLFLNVGAFKKFSNYLDFSKHDPNSYLGNVVVMSPGQSYYIPGAKRKIPLEIISLFANHDEIVTSHYALGVCLKAAERNIYITGDTGWTTETADRNEEILQKRGIDVSSEDESMQIHVLVSHLGSMKRKEFDLIETSKWKEAFYENHLGVLGTLCMIERFKPALCVVSEFGEELSNLRIVMAEALESQAKRIPLKIRCLPGDVGLWMNLTSKGALCYLTEREVAWENLACELNPVHNSILYVDKESFTRLGLAVKESTKASRDCYNGLDIASKVRRTRLIEEYRLEFDPSRLSKDELISDLASRIDSLYYGEESQEETTGKVLLLSTFQVTPQDLLNSVANAFPGPETIVALEGLGYSNTDLLWRYSDDIGSKIGEGQDKPSHPNPETILCRLISPLMRQFMDVLKRGLLEDAEQILAQMSALTIHDVFEDLSPDEKVLVLLDDRDGLVDTIEAEGNHPALCRAVRRTHAMEARRSQVQKDAFALTKHEPGCPAWYPAVTSAALKEIVEQEKNKRRKGRLGKLLKELQDLEAQDASDRSLVLRAISVMTTVNDVIGVDPIIRTGEGQS